MFEASSLFKRTEELLGNILIEIRILNRLIEDLPGKLRQNSFPDQEGTKSETAAGLPGSVPAPEVPPQEEGKPSEKSDSRDLDLDSILKGDIQLK